MRGWLGLYATSVRLGLGSLARNGYSREALIRTVIPLDPSRYLELPWVLRELGAEAGDRVLDLASPKLLAAELARRGAEVTSVDEHEPEVAAWRRLAPAVDFRVADGRALPFADGSFDHAYSVSVVEHIPEPGDEEALRELARVVAPGGRVVLTVPFARSYREDWRDRPLYADHGAVDGRYFFQRWYDEARLERLVAAAPTLRTVNRSVARLQPNWNTAYNRMFPWLVPLGPLYGVLAREKRGGDGDVVRLTLERT